MTFVCMLMLSFLLNLARNESELTNRCDAGVWWTETYCAWFCTMKESTIVIQIKESSFESGGDGQVFSNANQKGR